MPIDFRDIEKETGKSVSTIKKWRKRVEELTERKFSKTKMRTSRGAVIELYEFTEEEFSKFVALSDEIDRCGKLDKAIKKVWGDKDVPLLEQLDEEINAIRRSFDEYRASISQEISRLKSANMRLRQRVETLEEKITEQEENSQKGFINKIFNK